MGPWGHQGGAVGQALQREGRHVLPGSWADREDAGGLVAAVSKEGLLSGPPWDPLGLAASHAWGPEVPSACSIVVPGAVSRRDPGVGGTGRRGGPCSMGLVGKTEWALGWGGPFGPLCLARCRHMRGDVSSTKTDGEIEAQSPRGPCPAPSTLQPSRMQQALGAGPPAGLWPTAPTVVEGTVCARGTTALHSQHPSSLASVPRAGVSGGLCTGWAGL